LPKQEPERTCIVSRTARPAAELIRFVLGPDRQVVPDLNHKLPGRGVWVTARSDVVEEAVRKRLFSRAFKAEAAAPASLAGDVAEALRRDLRQSLSLANKAGCVITGFSKVESALAEKPVVALIHAAEAAEDGQRKLAGPLRKRLGGTISSFPVVREFSTDELGLALGRSHVIHAALVAGAGSDGFLTRWRRYRSYSGADADQVGSQSGPGNPDDLIEPAGI
jgi:predicted RNA-binding protein YlxR (DUF448 family)